MAYIGNKPARAKIVLFKDNDLPLRFSWKVKDTGVAIPLTSYQVKLIFHTTVEDVPIIVFDSEEQDTTKQLTIDAPNGVITGLILDSQVDLFPSQGEYKLDFINSAGLTTTKLYGNFEVRIV